MTIIKPKDSAKKVIRSFRLNKSIDEKLNEISKEKGETKTYVMESLLEYAFKAYDKEKSQKKGKK